MSTKPIVTQKHVRFVAKVQDILKEDENIQSVKDTEEGLIAVIHEEVVEIFELGPHVTNIKLVRDEEDTE